MHTITKTFPSIPFAHRAPKHRGHCRLVHGHNWIFSLTLGASERDDNGFVADFGDLKGLKKLLDDTYDHALLINASDPERERFTALHVDGLARVVVVPDCSCEGVAEAVWQASANYLEAYYSGRVKVVSVTVWEDEKNSATFIP